jgi:sortase (surface protein transpeptidase)
VYAGTNHFWVPSLGISRHVYTYSCARDTRLGNYIYRWGCGGANNVYLMGHAASVMKPLHDAYNRGRLRVGMLAMYADGNGRVRTYRVTQWRVVEPADSQWAMASQRVPSMTLQTCVGPSLKYRLVVRLVAVN